MIDKETVTRVLHFIQGRYYGVRFTDVVVGTNLNKADVQVILTGLVNQNILIRKIKSNIILYYVRR